MAKIISEETILNATTYMPLDKKVAMAQYIAEKSIVTVNVTANEEGEKKKSLPDRYTESYQARSVGQMIVLLQYYLNQKIDSGFAEEQYDEWGASAVFNQLDRFKQSKNPEVRNKVYDLLDDYREFCKFVGSEISMQLAVRNDPITRISAWLVQEIPPEFLAKIREFLVSAKDELADYRDKKGLAN